MYEFDYEVKTSDCGIKTELSAISAFRYVEDACGSFLGEINMTGVYLQKVYGVTWVYTKHKMQIFRMPVWQEKFTIKCFFSKISKAIAVVDFAFSDEDNNILLYSQLEMCLIDLKSGRIAPLSEVNFGGFNIEPSLVDGRFKIMRSFEGGEIAKKVVAVGNLDFNHHTNNAEYIRMLLDCYDLDVFITKSVKSIEVNYVNQSYFGDVLSVYRSASGNIDKIEFKNKDKSIFKAEIVFA